MSLLNLQLATWMASREHIFHLGSRIEKSLLLDTSIPRRQPKTAMDKGDLKNRNMLVTVYEIRLSNIQEILHSSISV